MAAAGRRRPTPADDAPFDGKVTDSGPIYREAPQLAAGSERVVSTDELTGVQALERGHPGLPLAPGKVERREFEFEFEFEEGRHGTATFLLSRDVVTS